MYTPEQIDHVVQALAAEIGGEGKWLLITHPDHHEIRWLDESFATPETVARAEAVLAASWRP